MARATNSSVLRQEQYILHEGTRPNTAVFMGV